MFETDYRSRREVVLDEEAVVERSVRRVRKILSRYKEQLGGQELTAWLPKVNPSLEFGERAYLARGEENRRSFIGPNYLPVIVSRSVRMEGLSLDRPEVEVDYDWDEEGWGSRVKVGPGDFEWNLGRVWGVRGKPDLLECSGLHGRNWGKDGEQAHVLSLVLTEEGGRALSERLPLDWEKAFDENGRLKALPSEKGFRGVQPRELSADVLVMIEESEWATDLLSEWESDPGFCLAEMKDRIRKRTHQSVVSAHTGKVKVGDLELPFQADMLEKDRIRFRLKRVVPAKEPDSIFELQERGALPRSDLVYEISLSGEEGQPENLNVRVCQEEKGLGEDEQKELDDGTRRFFEDSRVVALVLAGLEERVWIQEESSSRGVRDMRAYLTDRDVDRYLGTEEPQRYSAFSYTPPYTPSYTPPPKPIRRSARDKLFEEEVRERKKKGKPTYKSAQERKLAKKKAKEGEKKGKKGKKKRKGK